MKLANKINIYIAKNFFRTFFYVIASIFLLIYIINLLEVIENVGKKEVSFGILSLMAFLKTPDFINQISILIVYISILISVFTLSHRSEVTIMRSTGLSVMQILKPIIISCFILGILWVGVFTEACIFFNKKYLNLESRYIKAEEFNSEEEIKDIWFIERDKVDIATSYVIRGSKFNLQSKVLHDVSIRIYKNDYINGNIEARKMKIYKDSWELKEITLYDKEHNPLQLKSFIIKPYSDGDFILRKIINNTEDVKTFSLYRLHLMINDMKYLGLNVNKFALYYNYLLSLPILFIGMGLISCFFAITHIRNSKAYLTLFIGVCVGIIIYICSSLIYSLANAAILSVFLGIWTFVLVILAIGFILSFKKDSFY